MRAIVIFIGYNICKILFWVQGTSIWLSELKSCDSLNGGSDEEVRTQS